MRLTSDRATRVEDLEALAQEACVIVQDFPLQENTALTVEIDGAYYIGLAAQLSAKERKSCLAHELGHTQYAGLYRAQTPLRTRGRIEYRANKWAYMRVCPPGAIKACIKDGANSLYEVAEALELPESYVSHAIKTYQALGVLG